jgi:hypothetical protein
VPHTGGAPHIQWALIYSGPSYTVRPHNAVQPHIQSVHGPIMVVAPSDTVGPHIQPRGLAASYPGALIHRGLGGSHTQGPSYTMVSHTVRPHITVGLLYSAASYTVGAPIHNATSHKRPHVMRPHILTYNEASSTVAPHIQCGLLQWAPHLQWALIYSRPLIYSGPSYRARPCGLIYSGPSYRARPCGLIHRGPSYTMVSHTVRPHIQRAAS